MTWAFRGLFKRALDFPIGEAVAVSPANQARMRYNQTAAQLEVSLNGAAFAAFGNPADIGIADNTALAFRVHEGVTNYITVATTNAAETITLGGPAGGKIALGVAASVLGFFAAAGTVKATVTGSKGANAALTSLMTALAGYGLVTDSTSSASALELSFEGFPAVQGSARAPRAAAVVA